MDKKSVVHMAGEGRSFSSPGYPSYPGKGSCSWNITVSPGDFIKLTFWRIDYCSQNYVKVFDVTNSTRVLLGKFCSTYTKEEVYSHGNNLLIKFSSKQSLAQSGGFFATYESIKAIPAKYSCHITESSSSRIQLEGTINSQATVIHCHTRTTPHVYGKLNARLDIWFSYHFFDLIYNSLKIVKLTIWRLNTGYMFGRPLWADSVVRHILGSFR